ncbi:TPA: hypothetical protein ACG3G9_003845, partial [Clostridioides difficile]
QKMLLDQCNIDQSFMTGTKLKGLDLSNCQFDSLVLNMEDLNGCVISPYQAATFVGLMGIVIKS